MFPHEPMFWHGEWMLRGVQGIALLLLVARLAARILVAALLYGQSSLRRFPYPLLWGAGGLISPVVAGLAFLVAITVVDATSKKD